jgi:integrase
MGAPEVEAFLTHLAVTARVSGSTQNQAMQAILFLYRQVLEIELPWLENVIRAHRPKRLPVVLSIPEVRSVLAQLEGMPWLVASLLYGGDLRLMEALRFRVKDLDLERGEIMVRGGKGSKDRVTVLPSVVIPSIRLHLEKLRLRYQRQRSSGDPGVSLPAPSAKFHGAAKQWGWQFVFPADSNRAGSPGSRGRSSHHDLYPCAGQGRDGREKPFWIARRKGPVAGWPPRWVPSAGGGLCGRVAPPSAVVGFSAACYSVI